MEDLVHQFPILLEHYLRREIHQRLARCTLRNSKAEFHIQAVVNYLEGSEAGVFVIADISHRIWQRIAAFCSWRSSASSTATAMRGRLDTIFRPNYNT